ncbi:CoA transferase [Jannaschia sp. LMIT008]|uniref:CaiB/BaiF CoA transferase family protein n=1 Tax=Jannaschia maritima TaxID=3032585 RepID=UPI00281129B2|nr:CoA transferase [Jannaschia sp. LMIT008]
MTGASAPGPLAGIRVVDFTHVLAGPATGYMLGLLGAEVVKVESPRGDAMRWRGGTDGAAAAEGRSTAWATQAAGKASVVLDLSTRDDRQAMDGLLGAADVLVENHLPRTLGTLGLADLGSRFPRLIHCAMTGYGRGAMGDAPAYDVNIQAASGLMTLTGTTETGPLRTGAPIMDYGTALAAGFAICAALVERDRTGAGAFVDVSMFDTAMTLMASTITDMTATGTEPKPRGNAANSRSPTAGTFRCRTGLIALGVNEERHFAGLARGVGRSDWLDDPRFARPGARAANAPALADALTAALAADDAPAWEVRLRAEGVAVSVVRTLPEALAMPQVAGRGVLHPLPGGGRAPGLPFRIGGHAHRPAGPPRALGADDAAVLGRPSRGSDG